MQLIDETVEDFTALMEADFGPLDRDGDFELCLLDWLHFRARVLPRVARNIVSSELVRNHEFPAIPVISHELKRGGDLRPWLGSSVHAGKRTHNSDMLFNDWSISHFHLGNVLKRPDMVERTKLVLFACVSNRNAVLLDVLPHGSGEYPPWALQHLLETLLRTRPEEMERYELKGIHGPRYAQRSEAVVPERREAGESCPVVIDGRVFIPGLGISRSKHATRIVLYWNHLRKALAQLRKDINQNNLPYPAQRILQSHTALPIRLGVQMISDHLVVGDKNRRLGFMTFAPVS